MLSQRSARTPIEPPSYLNTEFMLYNPHRKRDLYGSISDSAFVNKQGPLAVYLRDSEGEDRTNRLQKVATVIEEMLAQARGRVRRHHILVEFYRGDTSLLLGVIRRLLPESASIQQMEWHELPLVITQHELLGEIDPLMLTPALPLGRYSSPNEYYDIRLLRYDGFGKLRAGIHALLAGKLDHRDMNVYKDVNVQGVQYGCGMTIALTFKPLVVRMIKTPTSCMATYSLISTAPFRRRFGRRRALRGYQSAADSLPLVMHELQCSRRPQRLAQASRAGRPDGGEPNLLQCCAACSILFSPKTHIRCRSKTSSFTAPRPASQVHSRQQVDSSVWFCLQASKSVC